MLGRGSSRWFFLFQNLDQSNKHVDSSLLSLIIALLAIVWNLERRVLILGPVSPEAYAKEFCYLFLSLIYFQHLFMQS